MFELYGMITVGFRLRNLGAKSCKCILRLVWWYIFELSVTVDLLYSIIFSV